VVLVLGVFFVLPLSTMIQYSFYTQAAGSTMQADFTLANFAKFFQHELYRWTLLKTLGNAFCTTLLAPSGVRHCPWATLGPAPPGDRRYQPAPRWYCHS
jgi:ABC-type spermidine/putrescine transport system permease subunit II